MSKLTIMAFIIYLLSVASNHVLSEEKIIYKYKEYEKVDLGNLEIKGEIMAPGDLSVKERARKDFDLLLFERSDFDELI